MKHMHANMYTLSYIMCPSFHHLAVEKTAILYTHVTELFTAELCGKIQDGGRLELDCK